MFQRIDAIRAVPAPPREKAAQEVVASADDRGRLLAMCTAAEWAILRRQGFRFPRGTRPAAGEWHKPAAYRKPKKRKVPRA